MHVPTFYRALDSTHCALCHRWAQYFAELDEPSYPQALRLLGRSKELVVQEDSHHNADNANTSTNANMSASPQTIHLSEKELDYERAKALMEEVHLQRIIQLEEEEKQLNEMFEVQSVAMDKFQQKLQLAVQQIAPFLDEENCDWGMDLPTLFDNDWNATNTRHRPHPNCVACGEEAGPNNHFTKYKITSTCEHAPLICKLCLQKWIKTQLEGTAWDKIACPECTEVLSHADIKLHATKAVFERVDQLALTSCLSSDATFTYCLSPHCTAGHLHDGGSSQPIFRCSACDCRSCVPCGVLWHEDLTCEQYQQSVKDAAKNDEIARQVQARLVTEEAASNEAVKALSKVCPNKACSARIEKNGGCDHMTCSRCNAEFCWLCFADYGIIRRIGNEAHAETCRWRC